MRARHYIQMAALISALGLTSAAMAQNTEGTTSPVDRGSLSGSIPDTPSSGAIVTPQDKALRMGKDDARAGNGNDDLRGDSSTSNDDRSIIDPGQSKDQGLMMDPGPTNDEQSSAPPSNRSQHVDRRPGNARGQ